MPLTPTPLDPERPQTESSETSAEPTVRSGSDGPLSFIPHAADGSVPSQPVKIRTGRYGELEAHELIHLLDTIEDERARARFRESIYIALFVWMVMAWVVVYGPIYLWHAPKLISPVDALREKELTVLNAPVLPRARTALPHPTLDRNTIDKLRAMTPKHAETPVPPPPTTEVTPSNPVPIVPAPVTAPAVTPRTPPPIVAEAPTPQPSAVHNNFATPSASQSMRDLSNALAGNRDNGGGAISTHGFGRGAPVGTAVEVLSPNPDNVNLDPYLRRLLRQIYDEWIPLIPEEVQPPLNKSGNTLIRFSILPDGRIGGMWLDGSTHDDALNRAAWSSINAVGQFGPLPKEYHQPNLELRIEFVVPPRQNE